MPNKHLILINDYFYVDTDLGFYKVVGRLLFRFWRITIWEDVYGNITIAFGKWRKQ